MEAGLRSSGRGQGDVGAALDAVGVVDWLGFIRPQTPLLGVTLPDLLQGLEAGLSSCGWGVVGGAV